MRYPDLGCEMRNRAALKGLGAIAALGPERVSPFIWASRLRGRRVSWLFGFVACPRALTGEGGGFFFA